MKDKDIDNKDDHGRRSKKQGYSKMTISMAELIEKTKSELSRLTGLEPSSVVSTVKKDAGWDMAVEMIEKHSIPDSMDILATYEVLLDAGGVIVEFRRKGMRKRMESVFE